MTIYAHPSFDQTSTVLYQAAEQVSKPGVWAQGAFASDIGRVCANIAIRDCISERQQYGTTGEWNFHSHRLSEFLAVNENTMFSSMYVVDWNDQEGQTAGYVVYKMRAAARYYKSKGL